MADPGDGLEDIQNPRTKLMQEVGKQMDAIEAQLGDDFTIGHVLTIVQLYESNGDEQIRVRSLAPYLEELGLLAVAEKMLHEKRDAENES